MVSIQYLETSVCQNIRRAHADEEVIVDDKCMRSVFDVLVHVETRQGRPTSSRS